MTYTMLSPQLAPGLCTNAHRTGRHRRARRARRGSPSRLAALFLPQAHSVFSVDAFPENDEKQACVLRVTDPRIHAVRHQTCLTPPRWIRRRPSATSVAPEKATLRESPHHWFWGSRARMSVHTPHDRRCGTCARGAISADSSSRIGRGWLRVPGAADRAAHHGTRARNSARKFWTTTGRVSPPL